MIFYTLLLLVLLSPIPYASNRPWSWSLMAMLIAVLAISWSVKAIFSKQKQSKLQINKQLIYIIIPFLLAIFWAIIQTLEIVPSAWIHPIWPLINDALPTDVKGTISLNTEDTTTSIMRLISYALVFWITQYYCQDRIKAKQVYLCLMLAGVFYSLLGLASYLGGLDTIFWQHKWSDKVLSSTFVNRNHFATYAGLTLLCCLALLNEGLQTANRYNLGGYIGWQRFFENLITRTWLPLMAFFIIGTALVLTHSRGGFLSVILAVLVLLTALNLSFQNRNINFLSMIAVFIIIAGWIFFVSGDTLVNRFDHLEVNITDRIKVYKITWNAILDNPWLGYGYGCFQEAFPLYKTIDVAGSNSHPLLWDYAHNSYLETLFELGIPAASALFICFIKIIWDCVKGLFTRKRDLFFPAVGVAASVLVGMHALVDFSIQIPAVAYTYALLMGVAWAQSFSTRNQEK